MANRAAAGIGQVVDGLRTFTLDPVVAPAADRYGRFLHVLATPLRVIGRVLPTTSVGFRRAIYLLGTVAGIALTVLAAHALGPHYYQTSEGDSTTHSALWEGRYFDLFAGAGGVAGLLHLLAVVIGDSEQAVMRWWWVALYFVVHLGVCGLCVYMAPTSSPADPHTGDYQIDAFFGVLAFVPLGYVVVPIVVCLAVVLPVIVGGLAFIFAAALSALPRDLTAPTRPVSSRIRVFGDHLALAGATGVILLSIAELASSLSFGASFHGGRGAGLAVIITTVLIGLGILPAGGAGWAFLLLARLAAGCAVMGIVGLVIKLAARRAGGGSTAIEPPRPPRTGTRS